jgi:hypothetical protein
MWPQLYFPSNGSSSSRKELAMVARKAGKVEKKKVKSLPTKALSRGKTKNVKGGAVNAFITFHDGTGVPPYLKVRG